MALPERDFTGMVSGTAAMSFAVNPAPLGVACASSPTACALERLGRDRDREAWAYLVQAHGDAIHRLMRRLLSDPTWVDDACQQAFLAIREGARRFRPAVDGTEAAARGWIMRVAYTAGLQLARSHRRHRRHEQAMSLEMEEQMHIAPVAVEPSHLDHGQTVRQALSELPERHRAALHLHYHAGLAYPELAQALSVSINAARVRVHRALAALRQRLAHGGVALSLPVLTGILQQPLIGQSCAHEPLLRLLHAPAPPVTAGVPLLATMTLGALAGCLVLGGGLHRLHQSSGAEDPLVPGPVVVAPMPRVAPEHYRDLQVGVAFSNESLSSIQALFTQVLQVPLSIDSEVLQTAPPVTLSAQSMSLGPLVDLISHLTSTGYRANPDGSFRLTVTPNPPPLASPGQPERRTASHAFEFSLSQATPCAYLTALFQVGGRPYEHHQVFTDQQPISLRVHLREGLDREEALWWAIEHGASDPGQPYAGYLQRVEARAWNQVTLEQALSMISADTGLPCRLDPDSGAMPRFTRPGEPISCDTLLGQLANSVGALVTQSSDGMVIYRSRYRRFLDGEGHEVDAHGVRYQDSRAAWWYAETRYGHGAVVQLPMPLAARIITVDWRERTVAEVAQDLQRRLGVAVTLLDPDHTATRTVLVQLPQRPLGSVLTCLGCSSRCDWNITPTGIEVVPWPGSDDAPLQPPAGQNPAPAQPVTPTIIPGSLPASTRMFNPESPRAPDDVHG
jgi:RNA polymerase sigma-70 factor (ECF subfamily)